MEIDKKGTNVHLLYIRNRESCKLKIIDNSDRYLSISMQRFYDRLGKPAGSSERK